MGSFFSGGGNKTTTSSQTNAPWQPVQGTLLSAMQSAQDLYNQGTPQIWSGQYLAPQSAQTQGAIGGITDLTNSGVLQNLISGARRASAQGVAAGNNQGGGQFLSGPACSAVWGGSANAIRQSGAAIATRHRQFCAGGRARCAQQPRFRAEPGAEPVSEFDVSDGHPADHQPV